MWGSILNWMSIARYGGNLVAQLLGFSAVLRSVPSHLRILAAVAVTTAVFVAPVVLLTGGGADASPTTVFAVLVGAVGAGGVAAGLQQSALFTYGALFAAEGFNQLAVTGMSAAAGLSSVIKAVTKAAFGDDDLKTLYCTTAWLGQDADTRAGQPAAGGLFRLRVDTPGLPQNRIRLA